MIILQLEWCLGNIGQKTTTNKWADIDVEKGTEYGVNQLKIVPISDLGTPILSLASWTPRFILHRRASAKIFLYWRRNTWQNSNSPSGRPSLTRKRMSLALAIQDSAAWSREHEEGKTHHVRCKYCDDQECSSFPWNAMKWKNSGTVTYHAVVALFII